MAGGSMTIFVVFILSRALHPMVIDYSKVDGQLLYSKNSPAIMSQILSVIFVNFLAWQEEGMKGVKACWAIPDGASVFIVIGLWYAFGDFLEMLSMGAMNGGVYQLLLQSKLLITAVMMIPLRGTTQSLLPLMNICPNIFSPVFPGCCLGTCWNPMINCLRILQHVSYHPSADA